MNDNTNEFWQIKDALINAAASRVLEVSAQMLANPMNYANRKAILGFSKELGEQILDLELAYNENETLETEPIKIQEPD
jgi:hypothetical protein